MQTQIQTQTLSPSLDLELSLDVDDNFVRVPGLFRRWEFEQVVGDEHEYRIEAAGELSDKTAVFAVYRRERAPAQSADADGVPVELTIGGQAVSLRARLLPMPGTDPMMAIVVVGDRPEDGQALARVRDHLEKSSAAKDPTRAANDTPCAADASRPLEGAAL